MLSIGQANGTPHNTVLKAAECYRAEKQEPPHNNVLKTAYAVGQTKGAPHDIVLKTP
jgi:hypothetical protein